MRKPTYKKAEGKKAVEEIAALVSKWFEVEAPEVFNQKDRFPEWDGWEYGFDDVNVMTKAGPAKMNVRIYKNFAHMYFCFDDPKEAYKQGLDCSGRLNRHSGKWNSIGTPENDVSYWIATLNADFRRVTTE